MKPVLVHNKSRPEIHPLMALYCSSFLCQLRGLTFRRAVPPGEGLLLVQRRESRLDTTIHMLFVFTKLAVTWINRDGEVVDTCLALPWRLMYAPKVPARYVLEANELHLLDFQVGDKVGFEYV
jgi:uncharacterized membrane protein (UPF0127 family)